MACKLAEQITLVVSVLKLIVIFVALQVLCYLSSEYYRPAGHKMASQEAAERAAAIAAEFGLDAVASASKAVLLWSKS